MYRNIIALLLFFMMLAGCADDGPTEPSGSVIMPLETGNRWIGRWTMYDDDSQPTFSFDTLTIEQQIEIDGEQWYEANTGEKFTNKQNGLHLITAPGYIPEYRAVRALYPASVGDTFNTRPPAQVLLPGKEDPVEQIVADIVLSRDSLITVSTGVYKCYHYHMELFAPKEAKFITEHHWYYAPDTGPVLILEYSGNRLTKKWELVQIELK